MIRYFFKTFPLLYIIWFKTTRKSHARLPKKDDVFFFTGFPRSGNSYITNLVKNVFPLVKFSHHLHSIAPLKIALQKKVPSIIIIRNPLDSISSLIVMDNPNMAVDNKTAALYIKDYIDYFNFLKKKINTINIISFDLVIKNPHLFFNVLEEVVSGFKISETDYEKVTFFVKDRVIQKKQSRMSAEHALRFSSTPNQVRTDRKEMVKAVLKSNKDFSRAQLLFEEVLLKQIKS